MKYKWKSSRKGTQLRTDYWELRTEIPPDSCFRGVLEPINTAIFLLPLFPAIVKSPPSMWGFAAGMPQTVTLSKSATMFPQGGCSWNIGLLTILSSRLPKRQLMRSAAKAAERGCSPRMASLGWRCSEFCFTSSRRTSLVKVPMWRGHSYLRAAGVVYPSAFRNAVRGHLRPQICVLQ